MKRYRLYLSLMIVILILTTCQSDSHLPWVNLFNGQDLEGWEIKDGIAEAWAEDGMMIALQKDSMNFPYLLFKEEFSDFILEVDVKLTGNLNSGILIRGISNPAENRGKIHGFQMEIDQSARQWTGGVYEEAGRKWITPLEGKKEALAAYKNSDWNHYRIEAIEDTFKIWVNDVPTSHIIDGKTEKGIIGFQIHKISRDDETGVLRIKNIRIITEQPSDYTKPIFIQPVQPE